MVAMISPPPLHSQYQRRTAADISHLMSVPRSFLELPNRVFYIQVEKQWR
jgi:hypothetical protein